MDTAKRRRVVGTISPESSADQEEPPQPPNNNLYWLQWNTKSEHFSEELLKLYQQGENLMTLTDVTLCSCEGQFIQAHKLILSLCSNFFRRLFLQASRTNVSANAVIVLGHVKLQPLRHLLQFMYTGEVDVTAGDLHSFLQAGEMLQVEGLSGYIKTFGNMTVTSSAGCNVEELPTIPIQISNTSSLKTSWEGDKLMDNSKHDGEDDNDGSEEDEDGEACDFESEDNVGDNSGGGWGSDVKSGQPPSHRKLQWTEIERVTEEELAEHWRIKGDTKSETSKRLVKYYYCIHGGYRKVNGRKAPQCPASIKAEIFTGLGEKTVYFSNGLQHCNHREKEFRGLSQEQRDCIKKLMDSGVIRPSDIVTAMKLENVEVPELGQVRNHLAIIRRKQNPDAYAKPRPPGSLPPLPDGQKRGRGRPKKSESYLQTPPTGRGIRNSSSIIQGPSTSQNNTNYHQGSTTNFYGGGTSSTGDGGGGGVGYLQHF